MTEYPSSLRESGEGAARPPIPHPPNPNAYLRAFESVKDAARDSRWGWFALIQFPLWLLMRVGGAFGGYSLFRPDDIFTPYSYQGRFAPGYAVGGDTDPYRNVYDHEVALLMLDAELKKEPGMSPRKQAYVMSGAWVAKARAATHGSPDAWLYDYGAGWITRQQLHMVQFGW